MDRAGDNMRIPVRQRSEAIRADGALREIAPGATRLDVLVFLHSFETDELFAPWGALLEQTKKTFTESGRAFLPMIAHLHDALAPVETFGRQQAIYCHNWQGLDDLSLARRLAIHVVNAIRRQLSAKAVGAREPIFISHAKADGREVAEQLVSHIASPENGLRLDTFYDALQLETGEDWREGLEQGVVGGSLLVLMTDSYEGRPWCNQELLWAKMHRRPILLVDLGRSRVGRTYPYIGNLPLLADRLEDTAGREAVLLELLSEALRCDLFVDLVETVTGGDALALPRPPELFDLVEIQDEPADRPVVYPDPPLPDIETALLARAAGGRRILAFGDLT